MIAVSRVFLAVSRMFLAVSRVFLAAFVMFAIMLSSSVANDKDIYVKDSKTHKRIYILREIPGTDDIRVLDYRTHKGIAVVEKGLLNVRVKEIVSDYVEIEYYGEDYYIVWNRK